MVSFITGNEDVGTDRNITLSTGWNLIGFSSNSSLNIANVNFTNSSGSELSWQGAIDAGKVQAYLQYREGGTTKLLATQDLGADDYQLRNFTAYWLRANEPGNLTLVGVGGAPSGDTTNYVDLRFSNGTDILNATDA